MAVDVEHPNPTLAPCPFCGANAELIAHADDVYLVRCRGCAQQTAATSTIRDAVTHWNRRAAQPNAQTIVGVLKDCPCCGLKAAFQTSDGRFIWVACPGCRLMTPPMGTAEAAAILWNRRLPAASASALVQHLRDEIVKLARRFEQEEVQASSTRVLAAVCLVIDRLPVDDAYPDSTTGAKP